MEQKKDISQKNSKLVIVNQSSLCLSGISKVVTSTENNMCVIINGQTLNIDGEKLSVKKLDIENGILEAEGTITAIKYTHSKPKENFLRRIFG